ncbi:PDDEXK nuclease domain-containing protein [Pedobacter arcticus]|uniref:PDDEXK nuclease domain-containing protein n=1 Tax=Pedobacter arcticus TaxID=752140 RepID=UPI0003743ED2|nr:PDDEXK nuclease domain-containing protein [Pedobacter arcticus]
MKNSIDLPFLENIKQLLRDVQMKLVKQVNQVMVQTYFELGKQIVEQEQSGENGAEYGAFLLQELSNILKTEFGKGYSKRNLELIRKFYIAYKNAKSLISQSLSWTHYIHLMRIADLEERNFYQTEAENNLWSVRELERQINSALFHRLLISKDKERLKILAKKGQIIEKPIDAIKDPYVLEFLNLPQKHNYSETDLEQALIDKIENFLLELGKGFTFVGRQVKFTFDEEHFRVDLVFYNRLLRCFVLLDLKIGKLKHQDLGQMQMYVNYYDRFVKSEDELPTIGIILCKDKKDTLVEITLPKDNKQIFASKYLLYLPKEEDLKQLIEQGHQKTESDNE